MIDWGMLPWGRDVIAITSVGGRTIKCPKAVPGNPCASRLPAAMARAALPEAEIQTRGLRMGQLGQHAVLPLPHVSVLKKRKTTNQELRTVQSGNYVVTRSRPYLHAQR